MCGISGVIGKSMLAESYIPGMQESLSKLSKRGPDFSQYKVYKNVVLGHARLSILDTSALGNQPMQSPDGRYHIIFNGEIFNYRILRQELEKDGYTFISGSDTEVLLALYSREGVNCLLKLIGFFAFAIYDNVNETVFIARDRLGIKPLYVAEDEEALFFASEIKALLPFSKKRELDYNALRFYLRLNYIPGPLTIFKHIRKLLPGHYIFHKVGEKTEEKKYYEIPYADSNSTFPTYENAKTTLFDLLEDAVKLRLIADVPLGAFLSGGIDSSVIVALASRHTSHLNTFSIGFADEPFFDETAYAKLVSEKCKTNHTVYSLKNQDLYDHLFDILDYTDEPFADSSAIAVYILSKLTKQKVTVALSGDGADEMFAGYNKHGAEYRIRNSPFQSNLIRAGKPFFSMLPKSRSNKYSNLFRQLERFADGASLSPAERYFRWCSFIDEKSADNLLSNKVRQSSAEYYHRTKETYLSFFGLTDSLNDNLLADLHLVLANDMLTKVDQMSMSNSLEVRVPFLDHRVVNFVSQLPVSYKIDRHHRKKLLKDTFRDLLPAELYHRRKQGFEVPILKWLRTDLNSLIREKLLSKSFVQEQGLFSYPEIEKLLRQLHSSNPGESHARVWGLLVFQYWYQKNISNA